jgi:hypothetical protein
MAGVVEMLIHKIRYESDYVSLCDSCQYHYGAYFNDSLTKGCASAWRVVGLA